MFSRFGNVGNCICGMNMPAAFCVRFPRSCRSPFCGPSWSSDVSGCIARLIPSSSTPMMRAPSICAGSTLRKGLLPGMPAPAPALKLGAVGAVSSASFVSSHSSFLLCRVPVLAQGCENVRQALQYASLHAGFHSGFHAYQDVRHSASAISRSAVAFSYSWRYSPACSSCAFCCLSAAASRRLSSLLKPGDGFPFRF